MISIQERTKMNMMSWSKNTPFVLIPYVFHTHQIDVIKLCKKIFKLLKRIYLTLV